MNAVLIPPFVPMASAPTMLDLMTALVMKVLREMAKRAAVRRARFLFLSH